MHEPLHTPSAWIQELKDTRTIYLGFQIEENGEEFIAYKVITSQEATQRDMIGL